MILLYGSSLISEFSSWWSFISSAGLLLFIVSLSSLYTFEKISHFSTVLIKSTATNHLNCNFGFYYQILKTRIFFSLPKWRLNSLCRNFLHFPHSVPCGCSFAGENLWFCLLLSSPRVAWITWVKNCCSCFIFILFCLMHWNILLSPLDPGFILILAL